MKRKPAIKPLYVVISLTAFLLIAAFSIRYIFFNKSQTPVLQGGMMIVYKNPQGFFSVEIPKEMYYYEIPEAPIENTPGHTAGGTIFSTKPFDPKGPPSGLAITYEKPSLGWKGGECADDATREETIAGQKVNICQLNPEFVIQYFKHPSKNIEYRIDATSSTVDKESAAIYMKIVKDSLRFTE